MMAASVRPCAEQAWIEQQLARPVAAPIWQLWNYEEPAIVLGCSQRRLLASACTHSKIEVLVRRSGGGAVLVGPWMLGFSIVLPVGHALAMPGLVASYEWIGELMAAVLREGGINAMAVPPSTIGPMASFEELNWACFGRVSPWEVIAGGRKIIGLAQVRGRHAVLFAGGLLLSAPEWTLLCAALNRPASEAASLMRATTSWAGQGGRNVVQSWLPQALDVRLRALLHKPSSTSPQKSNTLSDLHNEDLAER